MHDGTTARARYNRQEPLFRFARLDRRNGKLIWATDALWERGQAKKLDTLLVQLSFCVVHLPDRQEP